MSRKVNCQNKIVVTWCNNEDIKFVQRRSKAAGGLSTNEFKGEKLYMCKGCRKALTGDLKFIKDVGELWDSQQPSSCSPSAPAARLQ